MNPLIEFFKTNYKIPHEVSDNERLLRNDNKRRNIDMCIDLEKLLKEPIFKSDEREFKKEKFDYGYIISKNKDKYELKETSCELSFSDFSKFSLMRNNNEYTFYFDCSLKFLDDIEGKKWLNEKLKKMIK